MQHPRPHLPLRPAAQQDGAVLGAIAIVTIACIAGFGLLTFQRQAQDMEQAALAAEQAARQAATHAATERALNDGPKPLQRYGSFPRIELTDERDQAFDSEQALDGKITVIHFFFTFCPGSCKVMVKQLADLQVDHEDPRLRFLSITVDPERDSPEVLAAHQVEYSEKASLEDAATRWRLLTGTREQLVTLLRAAKQPTSATALTDTGVIGHVDKFFLIDHTGELRGLYDYNDKGDMDALQDDIKTLLAELPAADEPSGAASSQPQPVGEPAK